MNTPSEGTTSESVSSHQIPRGNALRLLQATAITVLAACGAEPAKPCCPPPCPSCGDIMRGEDTVQGEPDTQSGPDTQSEPDTLQAGPDTLISPEPDTPAAPVPGPDTLAAKPDVVTTCEEPEHVEMPDPTATIENYEFNSPMLNVNFSVTIPDEKCDAPVTVTVMGHVGKNPANRQPGDPTGPVTIPLGSKDVFQSGQDSIATFVPVEFDFLLDFWLVGNDANGKMVFTSQSQAI